MQSFRIQLEQLPVEPMKHLHKQDMNTQHGLQGICTTLLRIAITRIPSQKFGTAKTTKRGSRRDKSSTVDQKKSAESVKGKATANSSKKRGRSDKTKPKSKLTKEQKKKELALLELKRRELELMGSSSSDEDEDEDQPPKKQKGAVEAACEELQKEMDSDDSDDETVGVVVEG